MSFKITIARAAAADLAAVRIWLTQPGAGRRAATRLSDIRSAIRALRSDPYRWPAGEHAGTRDRTVAEHRIVYRIIGESRSGDAEVEVLRVFGPGQSRDEL